MRCGIGGVRRSEKLTPSDIGREEVWMTRDVGEYPALARSLQGQLMLDAEEVAAMKRLHELGWGAKRISRELGCARHTVKR